MKHIVVVVSLFFLVCFVAIGSTAANAQEPQPEYTHKCDKNSLHCPVASTSVLAEYLTQYPTPQLSPPPAPAPPPPVASAGGGRVVTYDIGTRGALTVDIAGFSAQVAQTFADPRGWSRLGVNFQQVPSNGQFTVVLSEASQVPSFAPSVCGSGWSCQVGRFVIINQDRWLHATDSWNNAGGSVRDYRHMVVNHETGHWLGHGHYNCSGAGQLAPVMQQQSMNLQGCLFNPWPLDSELKSRTFGI